MSNINITDASLKLFLFYASDAGNWGGLPYLNGNRDFSKSDRGNLTQLKIAGLLDTFQYDGPGSEYIRFTDLGKSFAKEHGIEIDY